jgi:hypothetical protein
LSFGNRRLSKDSTDVAGKAKLCFPPFIELANAEMTISFMSLKLGFYLMMLQNSGGFLFHDCCMKFYFLRLLLLVVILQKNYLFHYLFWNLLLVFDNY